METLEDLWTDLGDRVRGFVGKRVNDPHAADDIAQDIMLKVQAQLASGPLAHEKFDAWVFRVARNAVIDHYRARAVREASSAGAVDPADARAPAPDERTAAAELSQCVRQIIQRLPPEYAQALTLTDLEGLSQQELADRIGLSLSAAKSRVQRGREKLRGMILDCCNVERNRGGGVVDYQTTPRTPNYCDLPGDGSSGSCR
jgi:RNA polymerase sigma-70 factor (ECF subfamily)